MDTIYHVDIAMAAELCGIGEARLAQIAAQADTIYCTALAANAADTDFDNGDCFVVFDDNDDKDGNDASTGDGMSNGTDTDVDMDADSDTDVDTGTDVATEVDTDTGMDTDTDVGAESNG